MLVILMNVTNKTLLFNRGDQCRFTSSLAHNFSLRSLLYFNASLCESAIAKVDVFYADKVKTDPVNEHLLGTASLISR